MAWALNRHLEELMLTHFCMLYARLFRDTTYRRWLQHVPTTPTLSQRSIEPVYSSTPLTESPSTSFPNEAIDVELEKSWEDTLEFESVETFMNSTCGRKMGPKSFPCSSLLTRETLERYRAESLELRACRTVLDQPSLYTT